ncbi:hypothetical protein MUN77_10575 [Leucobacter allii]|uniref:hypothetical protein n=1 Tax=Leucobacter allii TaxID=2932247 RepID=UPI001FD4C13A|nr:hypothetical protein [Leucobacter allii]UOR00610.1 hypothetical protein MUN77_10575 [Leucobacter allii]
MLPIEDADPDRVPQSEEEALANLAALRAHPFNWESRAATEPLQELHREYADVAARATVDVYAAVVTVEYRGDADPVRLAAYLERVRSIARDSGVAVTLRERPDQVTVERSLVEP